MKRPIVVLLKGYPRLSETFIAQEILALERAGLDLRLVAMRRPTDPTVHPVHREIKAPVSYLCEYLHHEPVRVCRSLARVWRRPGFGRSLRAFLDDFWRDLTPNRVRRFGQAVVLAAEWPDDAEHLYAHFIHTPASVARYASLILDVPWSCSAHAKDIWTTPDWDVAGKLASAEWVVTCTQAGRDQLDRLADPQKPVRLIYHGLDFTRFIPMLAPRSARDGRDGGQPVILLTVGRAVEKKGLDVLVKALALIPDLSWRWVHIGGGALRKTLEMQAKAAGLDGRIDWLGARDQADVLAQYQKADLFVLPCRVARDGDRDGLPNVLMEAQSQGLACLSTAVAAVGELIEDGTSGLLVAPDDPEALAKGLRRLIEDPALRRRLGAAGALRVRKAFDHQAGILALLGLFDAASRPRKVAAE